MVRRLIEVVRGGLLDDLVGVGGTELEGELGLGGPPCGVESGRRDGLADVGEELGDGQGIGEDRDEGEGRLTGGTDQGEDLIDPGEERGPAGGSGRGRWEVRSGGLFGLGVGPVGEGRGSWAGRLWVARALSWWARSVTRGLRGALGAKTPW